MALISSAGEPPTRAAATFLRFWESIGGPRGIPTRAAFDEAGPPPHGAYGFLCERRIEAGERRYLYGSSGPALIALLGHDPTGHYCDRLYPAAIARILHRDYDRVLATRGPVLVRRDGLPYTRTLPAHETLMAPLIDGTRRPTLLVGVCHPIPEEI